MEAVKTILGSGLRVGMVVQGKKVRDDNKTLQQAGISQNGNLNLDTLGFTLEPSSYPVSPSLHSKDFSALSPRGVDHELTRYSRGLALFVLLTAPIRQLSKLKKKTVVSIDYN